MISLHNRSLNKLQLLKYMYIYISKSLKFCFVCKHCSVYFGFQCLFTFFWCKHTLFSNISENFQSEFRQLWNCALFAMTDLFSLVSNVYLQCLMQLHFCTQKFSKFVNFRKFLKRNHVWNLGVNRVCVIAKCNCTPQNVT